MTKTFKRRANRKWRRRKKARKRLTPRPRIMRAKIKPTIRTPKTRK